ncbi:S-formylglutathione hydrolase [Coralliovum pocilloporae]|uniref:S-formylglutathione hydrolase n=1 Tax=Coralliovum pocilloporae TaxID=3066369 RepID=UPI00330735E1
MELVSSVKCFDGQQRVYRHTSEATGTEMEFAVFLPAQALAGLECPTLFYLSGLTCTWENVTTKAGAQAWCANHGMIFIAPDTSPRGEGVANDEGYDLGQGAGFYVNATEEPWAPHFRMYDYVVKELYDMVIEALPIDEDAIGITGHSMGGHGALTIALRNPEKFRSVSAFAPIVSPMNCPWGEKALTAYLGSDTGQWAEHDACELVKAHGWSGDILVDQGSADGFLEEQLKPWLFEEACRKAGVELTLRMLGGYDHSYYFIASVIGDHIEWHAERLSL